MIDQEHPQQEYLMRTIGRSHHSGADGNLYNDLQTLTTALHIVEQIVVRLRE